MIKRATTAVKFLFRTFQRYRNEDTILIYQMGKVGSTSLAKALGDRAIQIHNFYPSNEPCSRRPWYPNSLRKKLLHWIFYQSIRRGVRARRNLKIITMVRDPVDRNVSMYFHDLHYWLAYYFSEVRPDRVSREEDIDVLVDCFRETFDHRYPLDWFDRELKRLTGIDVYEYVFDYATGCTRIEKDGTNLLIIQTEKLSDCWSTVEAFCGSKLELREDNRTKHKWYGILHSEFLARFSLNADELDEIYSSRYATFFFSEETRAALRRKWQRSEIDSVSLRGAANRDPADPRVPATAGAETGSERDCRTAPVSLGPRKARLVVTLATIPSRIAKVGPVIASLKTQTRRPDRIYVCVCEFCLWEQSPYDVPDWLRQDESIDVIVSKKDYGPANKLIAVLDKEPDPSTRIVVVDDDWAYNSDLLEVLERRFEEFGCAAIGSSGARLPRHWSEMGTRIGSEIESIPQLRHQLIFVAESPKDIAVDILQFGFGAIVLRGWFGDDIRDLLQPLEPLFFADDVLFSGYLESKGIQRICIAGLPLARLLDHSNIRPLHGDGRATRNYKAAIPEVSARLNIWPTEDLFDPRPPLHALLRYLASRAFQKAYRFTIRPLMALVNSTASRRS